MVKIFSFCFDYLQLDGILKESCLKNDEYCQFHHEMLKLTNDFATEEWFEELLNNDEFLEENVIEYDYVYNYQTNDYDKKAKNHKYVKLSYIKDIILKLIKEMDLIASDVTSSLPAMVFITKLKTFDFNDYFTQKSRRKRELITETTTEGETNSEVGSTSTSTEVTNTEGSTTIATSTQTPFNTEGTIKNDASNTDESTTSTNTEGTTTSANQDGTTTSTNQDGTTTSTNQEGTTTDVTISTDGTNTQGTSTTEEIITSNTEVPQPGKDTEGLTTQETTKTEETTTENIITTEWTTTQLTQDVWQATDYNDYYDYDYEGTTTVDPVIEAEAFYSDVFAKGRRFIDGVTKIVGMEEKKRRKRSYDDMSIEQMAKCDYLYDLPGSIGELRDGAVYSLAKINVAQLFSQKKLEYMENEVKSDDTVLCGLIEEEFEAINEGIENLRKLFEIKDYDDGLGGRLDITCIVTEYHAKDECQCECHKMEKLAIYNIYQALQILRNFNYERGGDLYNWYYNDHFERLPYAIENSPLTSDNISEEIISFEKEVLKDIR